MSSYGVAAQPSAFSLSIGPLTTFPTTRPRAISWPTKMTAGTAQIVAPGINTLHIAYRPGVTDRGQLYLHFRTYAGFEMFAFYDHYCFVRFASTDFAREALMRRVPVGIITLEPAQKNYRVPYPQPEEETAPSKAIHVTHLPTNYSKDEMCKVFRAFPGFLSMQFHGKYAYVFYESGMAASKCWITLRQETNLVVSYAKNAKEMDALSEALEQICIANTGNYSREALLRGSYQGISGPRQHYGYDDRYTFLPRDSIRQLDADIKNDFEKLLSESHCRLCPPPIGTQVHPGKPQSNGDEDDATWFSDSSCDIEQSLASDVDSIAPDLLKTGTRTRNSSTSTYSPDDPTSKNAHRLSEPSSWEPARGHAFPVAFTERAQARDPSVLHKPPRYHRGSVGDMETSGTAGKYFSATLPRFMGSVAHQISEEDRSQESEQPPLGRRGSCPNPFQTAPAAPQHSYHPQRPHATIIGTWPRVPTYPLSVAFDPQHCTAPASEANVQLV
ncbi:uncharacterized protein EV422DRAFT_318034 [Fimicolochytrium jonesii]|uniref:uncharacterized protein n=1 Tax=Fimicolochytrium jonesii TaxID=1396493 RepID=UPI0022FEC341|nr:uncharacterized protein EV422DRAFT_318034 [Fimicolochytrium jonesii]KAI8824362.1 hypothetical protein EV422DRAFT_318034 [Fimicolochytrium jonesii]